MFGFGLAVGLGLSIKLNGTNNISCVFFGDGAVEEGVFYESINFAVLKKLPVLFICENNLFSVYSPLDVRQPKQRKIYKMLNKNLSEGDLSCDYIIGCAMLFKRSFFLEINGFDENFFMYFEDNDICDRIRNKKKMVLEIPLSKMSHLQALSSKTNFKLESFLSIIHKISEYKYLKKNISISKFLFILLINSLDFFQRFLINLFFFKFKNSFKNLLRLISIFLYITGAHKFIKL